jgi:hypothetical protein
MLGAQHYALRTNSGSLAMFAAMRASANAVATSVAPATSQSSPQSCAPHLSSATSLLVPPGVQLTVACCALACEPNAPQEAGYPEIADVLVFSASRLEVRPREFCFSRTRNNKARENEHNLFHLCVFNDVSACHLVYGFLGRGEAESGSHMLN